MSNERFANAAIMGAKESAHCLINDVGTMSNGDDLPGIPVIIFSTSASEVGYKKDSSPPVFGRSMNETGLTARRVSAI